MSVEDSREFSVYNQRQEFRYKSPQVKSSNFSRYHPRKYDVHSRFRCFVPKTLLLLFLGRMVTHQFYQQFILVGVTNGIMKDFVYENL